MADSCQELEDRLNAELLEYRLNVELADLTPIEKSLNIVAACREAFGNEWAIEVRADGGFSIMRRADEWQQK